MRIDDILRDLHQAHDLLIKERDINGSDAIKQAVQHSSETIMWLDKHVQGQQDGSVTG